MLRRFLTDSQQQIVRDERAQLAKLRSLMVRLDAANEDLEFLDRAALQLDELFLLVIVGEFNSGKSAFINALLGQRFLTEGATPTTTQIHLLHYGDQVTQHQAEPELLVITYPVEWLRDINIVDTPGTNAITQRHQEITEGFLPRADLVLFVTSADRPFSESERLFLERIREWGKKVVVVVNKIDILEDGDVERVLEFVHENAKRLLGQEPMIFPVAARLARQSKEALDGDERTRLWSQSRFADLETYILHTLDERERLRLKLANPLGIAQRLLDRYSEIAQNRALVLREDVTTIRTLREDLARYEQDMRRDFKYHLSHIDNVLYGMAARGDEFFEDTIRLGRLFDLLNAERVRGAFEREVVADTSAQVEAHTQELIDWLVGADFRQWQAVMEFLGRRVSQHQDNLVGQVGGTFEYDRQSLLESVGRAARETVLTYDKEAEAKAIAQDVQSAVAQTALMEMGAVGLGALLVKILATTLADVSGVLAASAVAALGLYIIPHKRRQAKQSLVTKINDLRGRLNEAVSSQFERELQRSLDRIQAAIRPYTRFVETQEQNVGEVQAALAESRRELASLAGQVQELGGSNGR